MKIYLVGGAIRDELLGIKSLEKDWVVIGSSAEEMLKNGFISVGKSFPVFLHPKTKEEYALARKEIKVELGHKGFKFDVNKDIGLEEDLLRRDLTINAIAKSNKGELIDPYGGIQDIENRVLKHISKAFSEDPLRVFRVARFYCYLSKFNFEIHEDTLILMKELCNSRDLDNLSFERIWMETEKCLSLENSYLYFQALHDVGASNVFSCDTIQFKENLLELKKTEGSNLDAQDKWAILTMNLELTTKVKIPNSFKKSALNFSNVIETLRNENSPEILLEAIMKIDGFRNKKSALKTFNLYSMLVAESGALKKLNLNSLLGELSKVKPNKNFDKDSNLIKKDIYKKRLSIIKEHLNE